MVLLSSSEIGEEEPARLFSAGPYNEIGYRRMHILHEALRFLIVYGKQIARQIEDFAFRTAARRKNEFSHGTEGI